MEKSSIYGNWRAQVVNNKDPDKFGRVLIWIPDLMPEVDKSEGIWARPANNPIGGRNMESEHKDHHYMGSSFIPKKGAWVFIFFEGGNINLPYYFGALDLENTKVLPENQKGSNYEHKWTLLKTHEGRTIMISDDPDDARTEITGKKRQLKTPPTGDLDSVYKIDGNQTTILFDERKGKEKILIRTYKGDFIHVDIDERNLQAYFKNDIRIQCDGDFYLEVKGDINIESKTGDGKIKFEAGDLDIKIAGNYKNTTGGQKHSKVQNDSFHYSSQNIHRRSGVDINDDSGAIIWHNTGKAGTATTAKEAPDAEPKGERDT